MDLKPVQYNAAANACLLQINRYKGPAVKTIEVEVDVQQCVLDRTLRYYESEGASVQKAVKLPGAGSFVQHLGLNSNPNPNPNPNFSRNSNAAGISVPIPDWSTNFRDADETLVYCTDRNVRLGWRDRASRDLLINCSAPEAPQVKVFYVLVFGNKDLSTLANVLRVEVHGACSLIAVINCQRLNPKVAQTFFKTKLQF